jgi:hypothetical protein
LSIRTPATRALLALPSGQNFAPFPGCLPTADYRISQNDSCFWQSVSNTGIYEFLDELANKQIIEINSAVKPYSRLFISQRLKEAEEKKDQLNKRQQKELDFYLLDFGKELNEGLMAQSRNGVMAGWLGGIKAQRRLDLFYYRDSLFSLTINPILGGEIFSNSSGTATYIRNGAEARGYVKNWGFYASLRDNHEKPLLGLPQYLTQRVDGHIKGSNRLERDDRGDDLCLEMGKRRTGKR